MKHELYIYVNGIKCLARCKCSSALFYFEPTRRVCADCGSVYDLEGKLFHEEPAERARES